MTGTTDGALFPVLATWAADTGADAALTGDTGHRPQLTVVTADPGIGDAVATGNSPLTALSGPSAADADVVVDTVGATVTGTGDSLSPAGVEHWTGHGAALADRAVDSGVGLLLLAGTVDPVVTATVTGTVCRKEPVTLVRHSVGSDVSDWCRDVTAVRDTLFRARGYRNGPWDTGSARELLRITGTPELSTMVGVLVGAAARRTPVILDGTATLAAALLADAASPGSARWWLLPQSPADPPAAFAADRLRLTPVVDRPLGAPVGGAALSMLPLLRLATAV